MASTFEMSEPSQPDFWMQVQKASPGFFGALGATLLVQRPKNSMEMAASLVGGTATAYFLAPFAVHWMGWSEAPGAQSAMGFGLGMCGVALMPGLIRRLQTLIGLWNGTWPPVPPQDKDKTDGT